MFHREDTRQNKRNRSDAEMKGYPALFTMLEVSYAQSYIVFKKMRSSMF